MVSFAFRARFGAVQGPAESPHLTFIQALTGCARFCPLVKLLASNLGLMVLLQVVHVQHLLAHWGDRRGSHMIMLQSRSILLPMLADNLSQNQL